MGKRRLPRKISLSSELHLVSRAIDTVRILSEKWRDGHFNQEELPRLAHAVHGVAVLVRERLALLDCAVRDTLDPRYVVCEENQAFEALPGDDGDVVIRAWSTKKGAEKLRKEAEQAAHRLEVVIQRRRRRQEDES